MILIAEDDAMFRRLVVALMTREGLCVFSAADGREGLEISRQYPGSIDLPITDVQIPYINGVELCASLFRECSGIKAILLTGARLS